MNEKGRLDGVKSRAKGKIKSAQGEGKGTNQLQVFCPTSRTAVFWALMPICCYWKHVSQLARLLWLIACPFFYQGDTKFTFSGSFFTRSPASLPALFAVFFVSPCLCSYLSYPALLSVLSFFSFSRPHTHTHTHTF